jgi:hypothetical protein
MDQKSTTNYKLGDSNCPLKEANFEIFNWGEPLILINFLPNSNCVCLVVVVNSQSSWQVCCLLEMVFAHFIVFWEYFHSKHSHEKSDHRVITCSELITLFIIVNCCGDKLFQLDNRFDRLLLVMSSIRHSQDPIF